MKSLEEILMDFGCADDVFDDEGNFTDNGYMTYHRLVKFLYEIAILTRVDVEPIIRELDEICDLSY